MTRLVLQCEEELENGIKIFNMNDSAMAEDLVIRFSNFGAIIDHFYDVIGFQHLLEHCIFHKRENQFLYSNAETTSSDMLIYFIFNKDKSDLEHCLEYVEKWFFKNNDYREINLSRNLTLKEIEEYIKVLDNEYIYRDALDIPWPLPTFFLTNKQYHYLGGNRLSLQGREREIQSILQKPFTIASNDIQIFVNNSYARFILPQIKKMFGKIIPVKRINKNFTLHPESFFNHVVSINHSRINSIIFIIDRSIVSVEDLTILKIVSDTFFCSSVFIKELYFSFHFDNIDELARFLTRTTISFIDFLDSYIKKVPFKLEYSLHDIHLMPKTLLNFINTTKDPTYVQYVKTFSHNLERVYNVIRTLIETKQYVISNNGGPFYNKTTMDGIKYYTTPAQINFENVGNFNCRNTNTRKSMSYFSNKLSQCVISGVQLGNNPTNKISELSCQRLISNNFCGERPPILFYFTSLYYFFCSSFGNNFEEFLNIMKNTQQQLIISPNIILSDKIYEITTEYNFFYFCFKIKQKYKDVLEIIKSDINSTLRRFGLVYFTNTYERNIGIGNLLLSISSLVDPNDFIQIHNIILSIFRSYYVPFTFTSVRSKRALVNNFITLVKKSVTTI